MTAAAAGDSPVDATKGDHVNDGERFYWCQRHERVEEAGHTCPERDLLGPYPSGDEARNWKQRRDKREDRWKAQDDAWEGE